MNAIRRRVLLSLSLLPSMIATTGVLAADAAPEPEGEAAKGKKPPPKPPGKPVKAVPLTVAVNNAQRTVKNGRAVRAELIEAPDTHFQVLVVGSDGTRKEVRVSATGKVVDNKPIPRPGPVPKGEAKDSPAE